MAWLSGLADKAENLLNKIDQNTAAVLNKDKSDVPSHFSENLTTHDTTNENTPSSLLYSPSIKLATNMKTTNLVNKDASNDNGLPSFLNTSITRPAKHIKEPVNAPPTPSSSSVPELLIQNDFSSPNYSEALIDIKEDEKYLSNIGSVYSEEQLEILPQESTYNADIDGPNSPLVEITVNGDEGRKVSENGEGLKDRHVVAEQDTDYQKQILILKETVASLEIENSQLLNQVVDLQSSLEKSRSELSLMRFELEQHRARALKTLRDKEKLIIELKSNTAKDKDDVTIMELNQLRQEREVLREENQQICAQLRSVREELANTDLKLEKMRQQFIEAGTHTQDIITVEKRKRLDAEEDARLHLEEVKALKDEIARQRNCFTLQLQNQDSEISRLKMQLTTSSTSSNEVESRLASLTQTLVLKQQALEHLTTERNALRLQVEKMEHEYRNYVGNFRRNASYNNPNDTDDVKAQIPTFLMETPFDTSVARRVKRAYSSLDAISIRTGVFLRRYPLARILVLIYMALLQFWVLIVLLSQSPEAH